MVVRITRLNGASMRETAMQMQCKTAEIAYRIGCREMGIYHYNAAAESNEILGSRLDGVIAGLQWGDIVICQFPTWNGLRFERALVDRIKAYR